MSFYTSLSGLRGAQTELGTISNNLANVSSTGFKRSRTEFGDLFSSAPSQTTKFVSGQGVRLNGVQQQFNQGTLESTEKTLDLAVAGEGFFVVKGPAPQSATTYTRNGAFQIAPNRTVVDTLGNKLQLLPVDADGVATATGLGSTFDLVLPNVSPTNPAAGLANISVNNSGVVTATYTDGSSNAIGAVALASFVSQQGLRPVGDAHWQQTGDSGAANVNAANTGALGAVRSGTLERANVDVTEELVALIAAQRNFQANAKAIETATTLSQTIFNIN